MKNKRLQFLLCVIYLYYVYRYPEGHRIYSHNFDYFDYSGINRAVQLYTTPKVYVCDITILTNFGNDSEGIMLRFYN